MPKRTNDIDTFLSFQRRFSSERACERFLFVQRWPKGFRCPRCGGRRATRLATRRQYQCRSCRYQISITAGTVMHGTHLPLRAWFWAIFLVARHRQGVSALQLQADLGIGSYRTAWLLLHRIRACLDGREDAPLTGLVELDTRSIRSSGKCQQRRRGVAKPRLVATAIEVRERALGRAALAVARGGLPARVLLEPRLAPQAVLAASAARAGARTTGRPRAAPLLTRHLEAWLDGSFRGVSEKYLAGYLSEFTYRFNRRRSSSHELFRALAHCLVSRAPLPAAELG